jgi:ABC-type branched-subunit amino acid transport system substrate-binding protein
VAAQYVRIKRGRAKGEDKRMHASLKRVLMGSVMILVVMGSLIGVSGSGGAATSGVPVKVFLTAPLSDPSFAIPELLSGAQASAAAINAKGGINGHPVQIVSCNDQANPNQATTCADQAVSDHVTAVTGFFLFGTSTYSPLVAAKIPVIDTNPVAPTSGTEPDAFPINAGTISGWYGLGSELAETGHKRVALIECSTAACTGNGPLVVSGVTAGGGAITSTVLAPIGSPDFSSYVQKALSSGNPQAIVFIGIPSDTPKLLLAVQQANFTGPLGTSSNSLAPSLLTSPEAAHLVLVSDALLSGSPLTTFDANMKKYEPSAMADVYSEQAWQAIQGIAYALKGKSGTSAAALTAALDKSTALQVGAGSPPINMTRPGPIPGLPRMFNPDVILYKVKNGKYVAMTGFVNPYKK